MRRSDTRVRTRLVVAFTYISVTIIVSLTIPLAVTLDRRARAELERENLVRAGTIAQDVGVVRLVEVSPARSWRSGMPVRPRHLSRGEGELDDRLVLLLVGDDGRPVTHEERVVGEVEPTSVPGMGRRGCTPWPREAAWTMRYR